MASPPPLQVGFATKYGKQFGVDPRLLLAIGQHETGFGTLGAGRQGYTLGYGVTDSGILNKYQGVENQYRYAASTLAKWGAKNLAAVMAGKAGAYATDPGWEKGVASSYKNLGGQLPPGVLPDTPNAIASVATGGPPKTLPGPRQPTQPRYRNITQRVFDPGQLARGIFSSLAQGDVPDITSLSSNAWKNVTTRVMMPAPKLPPGANVPGAPPGPKSRLDDRLPPSNLGTGMVKAAAAQLGQKYVWGGESRKEGGFDCSGLVDAALRACGVNPPFRVTTNTALQLGHSVRGQPLKAGDMIVTHNGKHMVLYAGNGRVIAAPHTGTVVQYQPAAPFLSTGLVDIRRI